MSAVTINGRTTLYTPIGTIEAPSLAEALAELLRRQSGRVRIFIWTPWGRVSG